MNARFYKKTSSLKTCQILPETSKTGICVFIHLLHDNASSQKVERVASCGID